MNKVLVRIAAALKALVDNTPSAQELAGMSDALLADTLAFWVARGRLDTVYSREGKRRIAMRG